MAVLRPVIEKGRRRLYDAISDQTQEKGIDLPRFYNNPSYFTRNNRGETIALHGSHPSLVHWPLTKYKGGTSLRHQLTRLSESVDALARRAGIQWVQPDHWHSTVFSAVHSSDPIVISQAITDISQIVRAEFQKTTPYVLSFTRIIVTEDGGVLAVGYAHNHQLDSLRARLLKAFPDGAGSDMVHVTLGHLVQPLDRHITSELNNFTRMFRDDRTLLGQIAVDFLTYAMYQGPFLQMTIEKLFTFPLGSH